MIKRRISIQKLFNKYCITRRDDDYELLYRVTKRRLKKHLLSKLRHLRIINKTDFIYDIIDEAFLRIVLYMNSYDVSWNFSTWVWRIANNIAIDKLREYKKQNKIKSIVSTERTIDEYENLYNDDIVNSIDEVNKLIENKRDKFYYTILNNIDNLPTDSKNIIIDRELNNMSYSDISIKYDTPISIVKNRLYRNRKQLRQKYNFIYISLFKKNKGDKNENNI